MMLDTIGKRLAWRRADIERKTGKECSQHSVAKSANLTRASVSKLETELSDDVRSKKLFKMADFLEVNPKWLATGEGPIEPINHSQHSSPRFPILDWSSIPEIDFELDIPQLLETVACPVECSSKTFVVKIQDKLMAPVFNPGDLAFVDCNKTPTNDSYVIALIHGEAKLRQLIIMDQDKYLKIISDEIPAELKFKKITQDFVILGVVCALSKKL